jgi:transmembrane sensor
MPIVMTDELILRSLKGQASEAEMSALLAWRRMSPANEDQHRQVSRLWEMRRLLEPYLQGETHPTASAILNRMPDSSAAAEQESVRELDAVSPNSSVWRQHSTRARLAMAASLAILLLGAGIVGYLTGRDGTRATFGKLELITAATEMSSVRLADGSVVRLAPQSRLLVEITDTSRNAWLEGRAFFAVEHDPTRPFRVLSQAGEVIVRGTRFDLEARAGDLQLIVVDGAVALEAAGQSLEVLAGQVSRIRDDGRLELQNIDAPYTQLHWMEDFVAFEETPLNEVVRELESRYGLNIEIRDPTLASQTVTSWSVNRSPQEILSAVCLALDATCTFADGLTTIDRSQRTR